MQQNKECLELPPAGRTCIVLFSNPSVVPGGFVHLAQAIFFPGEFQYISGEYCISVLTCLFWMMNVVN